MFQNKQLYSLVTSHVELPPMIGNGSCAVQGFFETTMNAGGSFVAKPVISNVHNLLGYAGLARHCDVYKAEAAAIVPSKLSAFVSADLNTIYAKTECSTMLLTRNPTESGSFTLDEIARTSSIPDGVTSTDQRVQFIELSP